MDHLRSPIAARWKVLFMSLLKNSLALYVILKSCLRWYKASPFFSIYSFSRCGFLISPCIPPWHQAASKQKRPLTWILANMDWFWTAQDWSSFWENFCEHGSQVPCQSVFIQPLDICKVQFFPSKSVWAVTSNTWCWRVDGFLSCFQRCPLFLYTQGLTQIIGGLLAKPRLVGSRLLWTILDRLQPRPYAQEFHCVDSNKRRPIPALHQQSSAPSGF